MSRSKPGDEKLAALRQHHALNPRAGTVTDPAFIAGNRFFDARDLVQVKYEMLRRVRHEGQPVTVATTSFGFSRPSFYAAQALFERNGLLGLAPLRPGPRRAHKLSEEVVDFLEQALAEDASLRPGQLARQLHEHWSLSIHPRSIERALGRRRQKGASAQASTNPSNPTP